MSDELLTALYKKAMGYTAEEETREFSQDGELIKRKTTLKHYPPDIAALKAYLEMKSDKGGGVFEMSEAELKAEKTRLIKLLKE